jgi:hypothetical protein
MRNLLARLDRAYGANPLHLLALLACFALAGSVATHLVGDPLVVQMLIWFAAAVIGHDLVLFPLYALADRSLAGVLRVLPTARRNRTPVVPLLNYLRTPALGAGLLLLLFLPGIIQQGQQTYLNATGQTQQPYLHRWLLLTGALFAASAVVYAVRSGHAAAPFRAAVRQLRPLIERDERVITVAYRTGRRAGAMCTTHALYYLDGDEVPGWRRIGWADVADIRWYPDTGTLAIGGLPGAPIDHVTVDLVDSADLVEIGHGLISTTEIVTVTVVVAATQHAVIMVRQRPHTDQLVWHVRLDGGVDPADHDVRRQVDAALAAVSEDLGLPSPPVATVTVSHAGSGTVSDR